MKRKTFVGPRRRPPLTGPYCAVEMSDMQVNRDHSDLYNHGRLSVTEMRHSPKKQCVNTSGSQTARSLTTANRVQPLNDTILKCLNRDDPLRHAYLRARWQES